jgi:hypothetical protein
MSDPGRIPSDGGPGPGEPSAYGWPGATKTGPYLSSERPQEDDLIRMEMP